jgi:predicted metal-dependent hydrolase
LISEKYLYLLGNQLSLQIETIDKGKQNVMIENGIFKMQIKNPLKMRSFLDRYLKIATEDYIQSILPIWIEKTDLNPAQFTVRKMKKWGACTKKGKIIFNSYLISLPPNLIEYIICHELVHLKHFNHSRNFHQAVANFLPDVKKMEKELRMFVR